MASSGIFELVAGTVLHSDDVLVYVNVHDTTQSPQGTTLKITSASVWANGQPITIAAGTVTTSTPVLAATQTWNADAVTFTGIDLNVTDTASAAGSMFLNLRLADTSMFSVTKAGGMAATTGAFSDTTDATSSTAASVTLAGGLAVAKKLNVGSSATIASGLTISANGLTVSSGSSTLQSLAVAGTQVTTNTTTGGSTITAIASNASFGGNAFVSSAARAGGTGFTHYQASANSVDVFDVYGNGNVANANNSYGAVSDKRLKNDLGLMRDVSEPFRALELHEFTLKDDELAIRRFGVIAQQALSLFPWIIETRADGYYHANYMGLSIVTARALQETMDRVSALEATLARVTN